MRLPFGIVLHPVAGGRFPQRDVPALQAAEGWSPVTSGVRGGR